MKTLTAIVIACYASMSGMLCWQLTSLQPLPDWTNWALVAIVLLGYFCLLALFGKLLEKQERKRRQAKLFTNSRGITIYVTGHGIWE